MPDAVASSERGVPKGWSVQPLGEVTSWTSGGTPSKSNSEFWDGDIPWISAKSLKTFYLCDSKDHVSEAAIADGARLVDVSDILLLVRGMTLHNDVPVGIAMRPMTFNQDVKCLRGKEGVNTRYVAYWLVGNKWRLLAAVDQASHGTGRLRTEVLQAMDVLLPPPDEQEAIAAILGALDDKIEQNRRAQLFYTTGIPVCLWFLTRDKSGGNLPKGGRIRQRETLFIDARKLGTMQTRTLRVLTGGDDRETMLADSLGDPNPGSDIGRIVYAFRQWRGEPTPNWWDEAEHGKWEYRDIPGFCKAETIEGIGKPGFVLTPGRYVGAEVQEDDGESFAENYPRLLAELEECFGEGERLTALVRERLGGLSNGS